MSDLASYAASILDTYQGQWIIEGGSPSNLEFVMGGDEAPQAIANAPTFNAGDGECSPQNGLPAEGDMACFIDLFNLAAQKYANLSPDQKYYQFLLFDQGTT